MNDYEQQLTERVAHTAEQLIEEIEESQRAAKGCCLGLLLSIPIWICIVVTLVKLF